MNGFLTLSFLDDAGYGDLPFADRESMIDAAHEELTLRRGEGERR